MDGFRFDLIPPGAGVLCALSGGADSMYLLCRLLEGREKYGWTVQAAHLNHGLRPTARRDEDFVRDWCGKRDVPLTVGHAAAGELARREGLSIEEAGRVLRYAFLEETARRELLEETGLTAGTLERYDVYAGPEEHYFYPNGDEVYNVEFFFSCRDWSGALKRQEEEVEALRFFALDALPDGLSKGLQRRLTDWPAKKNA